MMLPPSLLPPVLLALLALLALGPARAVSPPSEVRIPGSKFSSAALMKLLGLGGLRQQPEGDKEPERDLGSNTWSPDFFELNRALSGLRLGVDPGPCPTEASPCVTDIGNLPDWVKDSRVVVESFGRSFDERFGDVVNSGVVRIYEFWCENLEVDFITVSSNGAWTNLDANTQVLSVGLRVDDLRMTCFGKSRFENVAVDIPTPWYFFFGPDIEFTTSGKMNFHLRKNQMENDNNGVAMEVNMEVLRPMPAGPGLESAPTSFKFRNAESGCRFRLSRGFATSDFDGDGVPFEWMNRIAESIMAPIVRSLVESSVCGFTRSTSYLDNDINRPGPGNIFITETKAELERLVGLGERVREDFEADEDSLVNSLPNLGAPSSWVDYANNEIFEALSVGLNEYLGGASTEPAYLGKPVINEVVDVLNGDTSGVFEVADLQEAFELEEYPYIEFGETITRNTLRLKGFKVSGLNTFTHWQVLDNGYADRAAFGDPYNRTLISDVEMTQLSVEIYWEMDMSPGEWMVADDSRLQSFSFSTLATFDNLAVSAATLFLLQLDPLLDLELGLLVGENQVLSAALRCALVGVDHFRVSGVQATAGNVDDVTVVNFLNLGSLLSNIVDVANVMFKPVISRDLRFITDNYLRLELNAWLDGTFFRQPLPECEPYLYREYEAGDPDRWFNLADNLGLDFVSDLLDNLIGGEPLTRNSIDINSLLQAVLRYVVFERPDGAINDDPLSAYTFDNPQDGEWQVRERVDVLSLVGADQVRIVIGGPRVLNLNSIWRLRVIEDVTNDYAIGFNLTWGNGTINTQDVPASTVRLPPLMFDLPISIDALVAGTDYAEETFTLRLQLQLEFTGSIEARFLRNLVYASTARDMLSLSCILATLETKALNQFDVALNNFAFGIVFADGDDPFFSSRPLGQALDAWRQSLQTAGTRSTISHFLNFVLDRVEEVATDIFAKDFDPPYEVAECLNQVSPFNGTAFASPLPLPNFTAVNIALNKALTPQPSILGADPRDWERPMFNGEPVFDLTAEENGFVALLAQATTASSLRSLLQQFADTEPDPLLPSILDPVYRLFRREADNSTTFRLDPNTITNVNYEPDVEGIIPGLAFRFAEIALTNVDSFTDLSFLEPYVGDGGRAARVTTYNAIGYGNSTMDLTFGFEIQLAAQAIDPLAAANALMTDRVDVKVNLTGFQMEALLAVAVNQTNLAAVELGELIFFNETTHAFQVRADAYNCTIKRMLYEEGILFPLLQGNVTSIGGPEIAITTNFLSPQFRDVIRVSVRMFLDMVRAHVPDVTQGPLRDFVNGVFAEILYLAEFVNDCPPTQLPDFARMGSKTMNLTRSQMSADLRALVDVDLLNPNSALNINVLLARFVNEVPLLQFEVLEPSERVYNGLDLGQTSLNISGFMFEALGTGAPGAARVEDMTILDNLPFGWEDPHTTRSTFVTSGAFEFSFQFSYAFERLFRELPGGARRQLQRLATDALGAAEAAGGAAPALADALGLRALAAGGVDGVATRPVRNELRLGARLHDTSFDTNLTTRIDIERVLTLTVGSVLGLYYKPSEVPCLLAIFEEGGLVLDGFEFTTSLLELTARCEGVCDSPMFSRLSDGIGVTDSETSADLTDAFNGLFDALAVLAGTTDTQKYIDGLIRTARMTCKPFDVDVDVKEFEPQVDAASVMGYMGLGVVGGALSAFMMLLPRHRRRRRELMAVAFHRLNGKEGGVAGKGPQLLLVEQRLASCSVHPEVPRGARLGVPLAILIVVALFLAANLNTVGASVSIVLSLAGDTTVRVPILSFTLATSINDMWNAGTYFLALVIFVASGVWPHGKSLLLLFAWFSPPTVLPQKRRGQLMEVLDALGKWSLIDAYVLIMLQVAFRFYLSSTTVAQLDFLYEDIIIVDVIVAPGASIYLFVCATMLALLVNHYMIHLHRRMVEADMVLEDRIHGIAADGAPPAKRALMRHVFLVPDERNILYGFSPSTKLAVGTLLTLTGLFVAIGSFLPLITFDFGGVAGAMLTIAQPGAQTRTYSAVSIGIAIRDGIPKDDAAAQVGVVFLQMVYLVFTFLTPLVLVAVLALLWLKPLTPQDQRRILFLAQIVGAWEALIVLLAALLVAASEVSTLAKFIVKGATRDACDYITAPLIAIGLDPAEAVCFDVAATVEPTAALLIMGCLLSILTAFVMFRLLGPAAEDRDHQHKGRLDKLGQCPRRAHGRWPAQVLLRYAVQPVSRIRGNGGAVGPAEAVPSGFDRVDAETVVMARSVSNPAFQRPTIDV